MKRFNNQSVNERDWTVAKLIKTYAKCFDNLNRNLIIDGISLEGYNRDLLTRSETELIRRGYTILEQPRNST